MPDASAEFMCQLKMIGIHMQTLLPHSEETLAKRIPPFKENYGFFSQSHYLSLTRKTTWRRNI